MVRASSTIKMSMPTKRSFHGKSSTALFFMGVRKRRMNKRTATNAKTRL